MIMSLNICVWILHFLLLVISDLCDFVTDLQLNCASSSLRENRIVWFPGDNSYGSSSQLPNCSTKSVPKGRASSRSPPCRSSASQPCFQKFAHGGSWHMATPTECWRYVIWFVREFCFSLPCTLQKRNTSFAHEIDAHLTVAHLLMREKAKAQTDSNAMWVKHGFSDWEGSQPTIDSLHVNGSPLASFCPLTVTWALFHSILVDRERLCWLLLKMILIPIVHNRTRWNGFSWVAPVHS